MRRFATAAVIAGAALASSAGSANAFFHLLFQSEQQTQAQQYYRNDPSSNVQISPIPREVVAFSGYSAGTIVVSTSERRLYYVLGNGTAIRYGIGVGRPGFTWAGTKTVARKAEWPDWTPPAQMLKRRPNLPRHVSRRHALPHPRLERAGHDRDGGLLRLHPDDQRRRDRPLQSRQGRHPRRRAALAGCSGPVVFRPSAQKPEGFLRHGRNPIEARPFSSSIPRLVSTGRGLTPE